MVRRAAIERDRGRVRECVAPAFTLSTRNSKFVVVVSSAIIGSLSPHEPSDWYGTLEYVTKAAAIEFTAVIDTSPVAALCVVEPRWTMTPQLHRITSH